MRKQILVVDDDETIRTLVVLTLRDEGFDVATAANGRAALEYLAQGGAPALILLDMRMPVMNGWDFAAAYRARPGPHAPIVTFTAAVDAGDRAKEIAAEYALPKPFELTELIDTVKRITAAPRE